LVLASSLSSCIGVGRLKLKSIGLHVVPDVESKTTFASSVAVSGRAIDTLLFRKLEEATSINAVRTFGTSSSGEGIARSTASLVLDGVDTATVLGSPVNIRARFEVFHLDGVVRFVLDC